LRSRLQVWQSLRKLRSSRRLEQGFDQLYTRTPEDIGSLHAAAKAPEPSTQMIKSPPANAPLAPPQQFAVPPVAGGWPDVDGTMDSGMSLDVGMDVSDPLAEVQSQTVGDVDWVSKLDIRDVVA